MDPGPILARRFVDPSSAFVAIPDPVRSRPGARTAKREVMRSARSIFESMRGVALLVFVCLSASSVAEARQKKPPGKTAPPKPPAPPHVGKTGPKLPPAHNPAVKAPSATHSPSTFVLPPSTAGARTSSESAEKPSHVPAGPKPDVPAEPIAFVTRLTDPVAVLDAEAEAELPLFHWEKKHGLRLYDGLRQGVAGVSEVFFPDDYTTLRFFGENHFFITESGAKGHRLEFEAIRRVRVEARATPIVLLLPGGTTITCESTILNVSLDERDHRYIVKNDGPGDVHLEGPILPPEAASVPAGNEVQIPIVQDAKTADLDGSDAQVTRDAWAGHSLELQGDVAVTRHTNELELTGSGTARVGGARIVVNGSRVIISKPRG